RGRRHATWHAERRGLGLSCSALRLRICTSPNNTVLHNMKTNLSFSTPAEVETECLVAVVLDRGEKERTEAFVATNDKAVQDAAADVIASGEVTGKNFETTLLHKHAKIKALTVVARGDQSTLQKAVDEARILGESQNFTRQLVNEPGNRMTPTILADHARKMSQEVGLKCEVYGAEKLKELKMGAFWGVAQGSDEPPALIVMRYEPVGVPDKPVLGLV